MFSRSRRGGWCYWCRNGLGKTQSFMKFRLDECPVCGHFGFSVHHLFEVRTPTPFPKRVREGKPLSRRQKTDNDKGGKTETGSTGPNTDGIGF